MSKIPVTVIVMTSEKYVELLDMPTRERWITLVDSIGPVDNFVTVLFEKMGTANAKYIQYHYGIKYKQPIQL